MTSIQDLITSIQKQLNRSPQVVADSLAQASGFELGFRHANGAFTMVRDDQVIELNAGNGAVITVDGPAQTVGIAGNGITLDGGTIQLKVSPGNLFVGYQPLNAYWMVTDPLDVISPFLRSPLLCKLPVPPSNSSVPGIGANPLDTFYISPSPTLPVETPAGPGTVTGFVPLSTFFHAEPLFGMNQQLLTLSRNLGQIISSLSNMGV